MTVPGGELAVEGDALLDEGGVDAHQVEDGRHQSLLLARLPGMDTF